MASWHNEDTNELCRAILSLKTVEECYAFFDDALTIKEVIDIAQRLKVAKMLSNPSMNDVINLTEKFKIVEMATPDDWADKTLMEIDIRKKHRISIIVIKRQDFIIYPEPETELKKGDVLIVVGEKKTLAELSGKSSEVIDVLHALSSGLKFD